MDKNAWYEFTDQNGERHVSRGDNGYIQQSINQGIPIYVNDKGEWFTEPYLELTPEGYVSHIPSWFKNTAEYKRWNSEFVPQMETVSATRDMWEGFRDTLKSLGAQGALRMETYKLARDAGITEQQELDKAYEDYLAIILEGAGQGDAKLDILQDAGTEASVADIARKYKELSKEDLNDQMQGLRNILDAKGKGRWDQKTTREAFTLSRLLNLVADNPDSYGKDKEFEGLLEASEQQKFLAHTNSVGETIAEGLPLFTWAARLGSGLGALASGKDFGYGWKIENRRDDGTLYNRFTGSELRGVEGSIVSGNVAGSVANILGTMAESAMFGTFLNAKIAAGASGSVLSKIGTFSKTFGGSMVYDWFAHDLPIDLSLFATDRAAGMTAQEAWYDDSRTQPLFGLFGPEVPYGLAMNLVGDAMMDLAIPVLGITSGAIWDSLDDVSGGALNKIRESVAVKNLAVQQTISDFPVIGTGLRKFSDWLFGAENAALIREARKASILEGSTSFYADAQNLLTLKNHYGAEVVAPMYKHLVDELGINDQIKRFNANANTYGGFGKTKVEWDTAEGGVARHLSEVVDDDIPKQVKQGLLDYQRLEELKGELDADGGLPLNPKREKEIAELERRVEALPDDIKKFAQDMSDLNKRVEQMMVELGLSTQDWIDALNADPRWKNYMTRQTLVPGGSRGAGAYDPATNKLLTGKRTGYYNPDQTLSPVMSLDMKVHAIGNAYAWNERAKALVGFEMVQGKITAGDKGVDIAKKIKEVRDTIAAQEATAAKLGYDTIVSGLSDRFTNVGATIRKLNERLGSLENITVKSAFTGMGMGADPEIKGFKADFESGKIRIADNVLVELDLSPADGASIIQNTYFLKRAESPRPEAPRPRGETPTAPVRTGDVLPTVTKEQFISKYGYDPRETINLGKVDTPEEAITILKDMTDANRGFISNKDVEKVLNKFPELRKEYDEIVTTLRSDYTRDDVITELYNRRVADAQGTTRRGTVEEVDLLGLKGETGETTLTPILGQDNPQQFSQKMFHGSGKTREEIYVGAKVPILGEGKYWAFDETGAKNFGDNIETETIVLERPLIIQSDEDWRALTKQAGWEFPNPLGVDEATVAKNTAALKDMVTKAGYDGIIIRVGKSQDGLLRDVFSIDQVVSYRTRAAADASEGVRVNPATDADFPGWAVSARDDGNMGALRMLDESNANATREGTLRDYYRDWKGKEIAVIEMPTEKYMDEIGRYGEIPGISESSTISQYASRFKNGERAPIPYINFDKNGNVIGQEGRHRTIAASQAGIEKAPVIIEYPKGTHPDILDKYPDVTERFVLRDEITEDFSEAPQAAERSIGRGISNSGAPYEFEIDADGNIVKMSPITSEEGLAESVSGFNQGYSISTDNVKAMGAENVHALNRMQMFYRDNGFVVPGVKVEFGTFYADGKRHGSTYGYSRGVGNLSFDEKTRTVVGTEHIFFNTRYFGSSPEAEKLRAQGEVESQKDNWHPKNATGKEATPIHENGHNIMNQLAVAEFNFSIRNGEIPWEAALRTSGEMSLMRTRNVPGSPSRRLTELERHIYERKRKLEADIIRGAFERTGGTFSDRALNEILGDPVKGGGLSRYARTRKSRESKYSETIAEAMLDYATNGNDAKGLSKAIAAEIGDRLRKFQMVESPLDTMIKNGLDTPNRLFKDKQYAFPASVKTDADRAKWLDQWRQKNPYLKGEFTEEKFQKANLWDAYFQKEIRAYDSATNSTSPEALIIKSGKFIEDYRAKLAKEMVDEIKKLSVDEFDSDLAMMIMGRNSAEITEAMDNFIIRQVQKEAEALAKNMDGGATAENINTALITLWSDFKVKDSTIEMLNGLVPSGSVDVRSKVDNLFETQSNGLASYEALPLDSKQLLEEKEKLVAQLRKENKAAMKKAEALDKNSSFIDGGTHLIHYREGGENVYVAVNDPVVASMLKKPYDFQKHGMIAETTASIANFVATTYRLGTTGLNPLALMRNILRDPIQAMATAGYNPLSMTLSPEVFYKTLRQYGLDDNTISTVLERIRNWSRSGTMTQEMRLGPGKYGSTYNSEVDRINKKLREVTGGKIITSLQAPLETWEGFFRNQIGQQSFVKNFKRTGDVNKALGSALLDTSNATTNFSHSIGNLKRATSTIPYLSSAINGTVSFWRLFNVDPIGVTARIVGGFMIPVMAITAWNLSSEENRAVYETLPEWYRQGHLVMVDPQGNVIAFPLPEELQQFSGTARKLIEFTQDATPFALPTIAAQGAFGFVPFEIDGFFADDGSINVGRGIGQMLSGIMPQAFTTIYELAAQEDLFTGQDLSNMEWWNQMINAGTNMFGTGFKNVVNSIGIMCGVPEKTLVGYSFQNNLARDLFGMGFNAARDQFNAIVGNPNKVTEDGKEIKATGLFAENEELQRKIKALDTKIATATDDEKKEYEEQKKKLTDDFINRVSNLMNNYQRLFQVTGGLQQWQKARLVQILTLGNSYSSANDDSYQAASSNQAYLDERGLAIQRYQQIGLPSGPTQENLAGTDSFDIQAAVGRFYGVSKQATQDFKNAVENSGMKDVKDEFYNVMQQIYDAADEQGAKPDYDLIERIQARYLQMVDATLIPLINRYGINILNNNDFIDAVRRQVNGMIPSDDWRQSTKNVKRFLSTKEFPTATVDVKKWLKQRYSSGMRNRNLSSDPEVTERIEAIRNDIDAGRMGAAAGKIDDLRTGINKANFYISSEDLMVLNQLNNMVK